MNVTKKNKEKILRGNTLQIYLMQHIQMTQGPNTDTYIYDLDEEFIDSLKLLSFDLDTFEAVEQIEDPILQRPKVAKDVNYYKSDLHRYNLKRSQNNLPPVDEDEFEKLIETQSIDSISGSESEGESGSEDDKANDEQEQKVKSLIKRLDSVTVSDDSVSASHLNTKSPFILFGSKSVTNDEAIGIYKASFPTIALNDPLGYLKHAQEQKGSMSAILMIGGGHFAGAIISHRRNDLKSINNKDSLKMQQVNVIASKTFHRYTTRRKQGGSQGTSDNSRGKAISAGSSIRRYNEKALAQEVRELLAQWSVYLRQCTAIYIRANGPTNKKVLIGYEGSPFEASDDRIRKLPFSTQRASLSEVKRSWVELTHYKIVALPKIETVNEKDPTKSTQEKSTNSNLKRTEGNEDDRRDKQIEEVLSILRKQKAPRLLKWVKDNQIDVDTYRIDTSAYAQAPTLLHYASANGLSHMIQILLINLKASPLVQNRAGRYPAELADQNTKRAFQIARYKLGESHCDWDKAKVLPARSKEEFDDEDRVKEEEERLAKQNLLKAEASKEVRNTSSMKSNQNDLTGLNEEQRLKLMREQRARAAEARLKR
ncbi:hypothetical protein CORT_0C03470 [Candida orthopsilosis Co 90-125]|uniref:VLRF1 domain-containing protein n=1 Tax=Candida orthopsilosis (strain 90-125) TaxID=1136231 RepID=H8X3T3_CANO9|nr:hypothetical protein CORT_0C03470 [Candida orthopsilosis Co 90-125]CCG25721.1 hypothetical protein CORT_0C03470 [Candida orthopsilosis Co 90-125]